MGNERNNPCMCGSGKKFKKCCMDKIPILREKYKEAVTLDKKSLMVRIREWNNAICESRRNLLLKIWEWIKNIFKKRKEK